MLRRQWKRVAGLLILAAVLVHPAFAKEEPAKEETAKPRLEGLNGLAIEASVKKGPHGPKDAVEVVVRISNVGRQPLVVNTRNLFGREGEPGELFIRLLGPDLRPRPFQVRYDAAEKSDEFRKLRPGDVVRATWDLAFSHDLDAEGFYHVQVLYVNEQSPADGKAWKGQLASRVLRFLRKGERKAK